MIENPVDIEKKSFEIIRKELDKRKIVLKEEHTSVVMRVIHTTADFDYADNLVFSDGVVEILKNALKRGCHIVTDTSMAMAGINKRTLEGFSGQVHCHIGDDDVAVMARERGITRAVASMEKSAKLCQAHGVQCIYAIGNAPTALMELCRLVDVRELSPVAIIGVPVGFVNVVESKEMLCASQVPFIVAKGRKGGSNVAAAICNAVMYEAVSEN